MSIFDFERYAQSLHCEYATQDVKIKKPMDTPQHERGKRGKIEIFSPASRRRLLEVCRNCGYHIKSQIVLTYHFGMPSTGRQVKAQLNNFLTQLRNAQPGVKYIWILEFQKRGVPHFHLFTDVHHEDEYFHQWCARTWNRVLEESPQHLLFQADKRNFMKWEIGSGNYLSKEYLSKMDQKIVPEKYMEVGRFWGNSRNMIPLWQTLVSGVDISQYAYAKAVRIASKYRERFLRKFKIKINYRNKARTYTLKNATNIFIQLLEFYENEQTYVQGNYCHPMPALSCPFRGY